MEIAKHIVVCNEVAKEESFTYVGKELDVVIHNDVNVGMDDLFFVVDLELYVH